jgi:acyl-coenzyme A synthetase/AMP-(fatty) acid ligase
MGDLAYRDESGRLWLVGRVHTIVRRADKIIYPVPVEALAASLPFVHRAALTGLPDPQLGQRTCLTVERSAGIPADWQEQLKALCANHGWTIDMVRAIRHMPVDARHNARIDYRRLK